MHHSPLRSWSTLGVALVFAACASRESATQDEEELARAYTEAMCNAASDCGCPSADVDACVEAQLDDFLEGRDQAQALGLTFDADCLVALTEQNAAPKCGSATCQVYYGNKQRGDDCTRIAANVPMSTCARGLDCQFDTCWDDISAVPAVGLGEVCWDTAPVAGCENGLICDIVGGLCVTPVGDGEACSFISGEYCDIDSYCNADLVCTPNLPPGAACTLEDLCDGHYHCDEGVCVEFPETVCYFVEG